MQFAECLVDTNVLIRTIRRHGAAYPTVSEAVDRLLSAGTILFYTHQNIAEMWNVMTRPADRNGLGLETAEAQFEVEVVERAMQLLPENELVYRAWRDLLVRHQVRGVQVHDARLVAAMQVHHLRHLLTLNVSDFLRFPEIETIHPRELVETAR